MLKKWLRNRLLILLCIFIAHQKLICQDTTIYLKPVEISANIIENAKSTKTVFLIDSISKTTSKSVSDLLEKNSSIFIKKYGKGQLSSISIRGTGASHTQIYWNGFKINSPTLGQTDLSLLPLFFLQEANVNYGSSSILDGSGGLGGSVQLKNSVKWKNGLHFILRKEFASFSNSVSKYGISYGNNRIFYQLKILNLKGINDFQFNDLSSKGNPTIKQINNGVVQSGMQQELSVKLTDRDILNSTLYYFKSKREIPPIIGAISNNEIQIDNNFRSFIAWNSFREKYKSELKVSFFNEKMIYEDEISSIFSELNVNTYQGSYKFNFKLFENLNIDLLALESYSNVKSLSFESGMKERNELAFYFKMNQQIKKINYDFFVRQELINNYISPIVLGLGLKYNVLNKDKLNISFNLSNNYRTPTLNDLYWNPGGNIDLLPEHGWSSELGLESTIMSLDISVHGFYGEIDNWIQWLPTNSSIWTPINLKSVINNGIETSVKYQNNKFFIPFLINVNYAYTNSINKKSNNNNDNSIGKTLIYVPNHKFTCGLNFQFKGYNLNYNQIYTSKVFIDATNTIYLPHYFPANISINKEFKFVKNSMNIQFQVNNVFDEPYQVVANRPIAGINYEIKFNLKI